MLRQLPSSEATMTTMEAWRLAFKEINGRSPSKKDMDLGPSSLRSQVELRRSPRKKRTFDLILKLSTSEESSHRSGGRHFSRTETSSVNILEGREARALRFRLPSSVVSPATVQRRHVPLTKQGLEESRQWELSARDCQQPVAESITAEAGSRPVGEQEHPASYRESSETFRGRREGRRHDDEKPEGPVEKKPRKKSVFRLKNTSDSFVRINLRKKTYAPKSKNKFKKKWHKHKFNKYNK